MTPSTGAGPLWALPGFVPSSLDPLRGGPDGPRRGFMTQTPPNVPPGRPKPYDPVQARIERADEMFRDHRVTVQGMNPPGSPPNMVVFRAPTHSNGWMHLEIIRGTHLVIVGDLGEAVYQWPGDPGLTFGWLAGLNLHYFRGKCQASEVGRRFEEWDERVLPGHWARYIENFEGETLSRLQDWWSDDLSDDERGNRDDFNREVNQIGGKLGLDGDGLYDLGVVPALRCVMHWRALQLLPERGLVE